MRILALWEYCEKSAKFIFGDYLGDPIADEILRGVRESGDDGITRTEISSLFGRNKPSWQINLALKTLLEKAMIQKEKVSGPGRTAERFYVTN